MYLLVCKELEKIKFKHVFPIQQIVGTLILLLSLAHQRIFVLFGRYCYVSHFAILHSTIPCIYFFLSVFVLFSNALNLSLLNVLRIVHTYFFILILRFKSLFTMNLIVHQAVHLRSFCCTNCSVAAFSSKSDLKRKSYAY